MSALGNRAWADEALIGADQAWGQLNPPLPLKGLKFFHPDGTPGSLDEFAGRVVVVNLWATWCPSCKIELPSLNRLAARIKPFGGVVLAISIDDQGMDAVAPFIKAHGYQNLHVATDADGADLDLLGADGIPATVVLRPDGRAVVALEGGADWDTDAVVAFLQKLAGPQKAPVASKSVQGV
ncbi:TlpA disulfide reductase family protein [Acidocella sp.]|uniref:TlpA disulfide reductase family protein n=1 Tax=Acidocella sp. TaxID=50710 RepID=UPI00262E2FEF|nr:TlpA disulfide reductase family protein [Acidocella sp.]